MQSLKEKAWITEQSFWQARFNNGDNYKTVEDFKELNERINQHPIISIEEISRFIVESTPGFAEIKEFVESNVENAYLLDDKQTLMLLTLACAKTLSEHPNLATWSAVTSIRYNSWEVENWFGAALEFYSEENNKTKSIIMLAREVLANLLNGKLQPSSERYQGIVQQEADAWKRETEPLKKIWCGLRGSKDEFMPYLGFSSLFGIWYKHNPSDFISALLPLNPYIANSLLAVSGITFFGATFSTWQQVIELIPNSFEKNGTYSKSIKSYLLPLLLEFAYRQLLQAKQHTESKEHALALISNIVEALEERQDFVAIVMRWGNWLKRITLQDTENTDEFSSSSYIAGKLIDALGERIQSKDLLFLIDPAKDFEGWEHWAHHSLMADFVYKKYLPVYAVDKFKEDWQLNLLSWKTPKAEQLQKRAFDYIGHNENYPSKVAYQLAYLFTKTANPYKEWKSLWQNTQILRELVQFGFKTDIYGLAYDERTEASNLLVQCFSIGLATLDLLVTDEEAARKTEIKKLFSCLHACLITMLYIDTTINQEKWQSLYKHLAIRRVLWQGGTEEVFSSSDVPTLNEFIELYEKDTFQLATLLENILLNLETTPNIESELRHSSIDFKCLVVEFDKLKKIDARRYSSEIQRLKFFANQA